jgi:hypothetical protein
VTAGDSIGCRQKFWWRQGIQSGVAKKSGGGREFNRVSPKNLVTAGNSIGCRQKFWWRQGIQLGVSKNSGRDSRIIRVSPNEKKWAEADYPELAKTVL